MVLFGEAWFTLACEVRETLANRLVVKNEYFITAPCWKKDFGAG